MVHSLSQRGRGLLHQLIAATLVFVKQTFHYALESPGRLKGAIALESVLAEVRVLLVLVP
jgi:hypothetical protein